MSDERPAAHEFTDLAADYALGVLPEAERRAFEAHLAGCELCAAAVQENARVTALLAAAVDPVTPPAQLRERVLAAARRSPREPSGVADRARPVLSGAASRGEMDRPRDARAARRSSVLPWLAAAAALVFAAGLGWNLRAERAGRAAAEQQLAASRSAVAERDALLETVLSPRVETTLLTATDQAPSVRLYWNRERGTVVLAAEGLPSAAPGRTYQLWGIATGETPQSLGTFNTNADGVARVTLTVPAGARFNVSAVTEEPEGGSPQPTTTPFLAGNWERIE